MCVPAIMPALATVGKTVGTALGLGGGAAGAGGLGMAGNAAVALQTIGGGLTALSQYQNAKVAGKVARQNAAAADEAARERIAAGERESDKQRRIGAIQEGRTRAAMAANGLDPTGADALSFLDEQGTLIEEDAYTIRENARRGAQQGAQTAANFRAEAATARQNAFFQPISTVLTTGAKVGNKYSTWVAENRRDLGYA